MFTPDKHASSSPDLFVQCPLSSGPPACIDCNLRVGACVAHLCRHWRLPDIQPDSLLCRGPEADQAGDTSRHSGFRPHPQKCWQECHHNTADCCSEGHCCPAVHQGGRVAVWVPSFRTTALQKWRWSPGVCTIHVQMMRWPLLPSSSIKNVPSSFDMCIKYIIKTGRHCHAGCKRDH